MGGYVFFIKHKKMFFLNEELFSRTVRSFFQNQKDPTNPRFFIFSYFNFFILSRFITVRIFHKTQKMLKKKRRAIF